MIRLEPISAAAMKVVPSEKLTVADFRQLGPQIDAMIDRSGRIRVVVDVTEFGGWENLKAFEIHAGFVKTHQMYVERLALIAGHDWQDWLVDTLRMFLHPQAKAFEKRHEGEAMRWIAEP
jgi:SpoIIAA-like